MEDNKDKESTLPNERGNTKKHSIVGKIVHALILLILILLIGCGCFIAGIMFQNGNSIDESPTVEVDLAQLLTDVQEVGELTTVDYMYTDMGKFEDSAKFNGHDIPLTTKSFILSWDGVIKAGIDATKIEINVNNTAKVINVHIPEAEILSHETDEDSVQVFDENNNIFNPIEVEDYTSFFAQSKKQMEERALENGLLDEASENAKTVITNILNSDGTIKDNYSINFN